MKSEDPGAVQAHPYARRLLVRLHIGLLAAGAAAGSSGCQAPPGVASAGSNAAFSGSALVPDEQGRVDAATTGTTGIHGRWLTASDATDCQSKGQHPRDACSKLITPDEQAPELRPTADLGICVVGVTAQVLDAPDGNPDWSNMWGAEIGLTLNGGEPYDAIAHGVTGFAFHLDSEPASEVGIRVELPTRGFSGGAPAWGGASLRVSPIHVGRNEFRWAEVGGPNYMENPPRFDPTQLIALEFRVPPRRAAASSFAFCIHQLSALED